MRLINYPLTILMVCIYNNDIIVMKGCMDMEDQKNISTIGKKHETPDSEQNIVDKYGFPITFPETVLNNMREKLSIPMSVFRNVHDYFDAANNLYARIPLRMLYKIYNSQNPSISEDDFLYAAEIISHEQTYYAIVPRKVFHEDFSESHPMEQELVAQHLYAVDDDEYYKMEQAQEGKTWYVPSREKFLKYADSFYTEETPQLLALTNYLQNTQQKLNCPPREIAEELEGLFRLDALLQDIVDDAQRLGVRFQAQTDFRLFIKLCLNLSHHCRRYIHRGHTPAELGLPQKNLEDAMKDVSYNNHYRDPLADIGQLLHSSIMDSSTISGKPARNAPCSCGSGRKYKNCCGKGK